MLALSSLALAAMLFPAPAAHASHWAFSVAGSTFTPTVTGNASPTPPTWSAPTLPSNNSLAFTSTNVTAKDTQATSNPSCTCSATLSLTVTATWVHDTAAQTDITDPAPTKVWIVENGSAAWGGSINVAAPIGGGGNNAVQGPRGMLQPAVAPAPVCTNTAYKADDGLKDVEIDVGTPVSSGSSMTPPASGAVPPAPPGWSVQTVSGKSFTITRTLLAKVTASGNVPCTASASCTLSYSVSIHAQPYNFRSNGYTGLDGANHPTRVSNNTFATLALSYIWDSTNGSKGDLAPCQILENITWDSNPPGVGGPGTDAVTGGKVYIPPSPPTGRDPQGNPVAYPNPTVTKKPATDPGITDTFSPETYFSGPPYRNVSWWGDQVYVFNDSFTGETATPVPGPAAGSARITRTVAPVANSTNFGYTISTRGYSAGPYTLPGQ